MDRRILCPPCNHNLYLPALRGYMRGLHWGCWRPANLECSVNSFVLYREWNSQFLCLWDPLHFPSLFAEITIWLPALGTLTPGQRSWRGHTLEMFEGWLWPGNNTHPSAGIKDKQGWWCPKTPHVAQQRGGFFFSSLCYFLQVNSSAICREFSLHGQQHLAQGLVGLWI